MGRPPRVWGCGAKLSTNALSTCMYSYVRRGFGFRRLYEASRTVHSTIMHTVTDDDNCAAIIDASDPKLKSEPAVCTDSSQPCFSPHALQVS